MSAKPRKRRSPGEGGAYSYPTKAGERWRVKGMIQLPDGTLREVNKRGFLTKKAALDWLGDAQSDGRKGQFIEPSKQRLGAYGTEVIDGLRIGAQTKASYRKNWRLHVEPYPVGQLQLAQLTGLKLTSHYRALEKAGRKDHREGEGLSSRTVRYLHTIISRVLRQAVKDGLLLRNPAEAATPPTAREARPPEITCWSAAQLAAFLAWAEGNSQSYALWHMLACTGARRGEMLALRWRDVDLDGSTISIRRSAGIVRVAGEGAEIREGDTKSGKPRVVDLDPGDVAVLRAHRKARGSMALQLARDDALVFGDIEGRHRNPEHVSRQFARDIQRCQKHLGDDSGEDSGQAARRPLPPSAGPAAAVPVVVPPTIRLHDLRHTHATLLLTAREPVHVVSQRLGHASPVVTMTVYAHVLPGSQREAAGTFARLLKEASGQ